MQLRCLLRHIYVKTTSESVDRNEEGFKVTERHVFDWMNLLRRRQMEATYLRTLTQTTLVTWIKGMLRQESFCTWQERQ